MNRDLRLRIRLSATGVPSTPRSFWGPKSSLRRRRWAKAIAATPTSGGFRTEVKIFLVGIAMAYWEY